MSTQGKIKQKAFFLKFFSIRTKKVLTSLFVFFVLISFGLIFLKLSDAYPFIPAENYYVESDPRQAATADFDSDGFLDLAVTNYRTSTVSIFLNNGDTTFDLHDNYPSGGQGTRAISAGNFDPLLVDTDIDLAVVNHASGTINLLLNDGTGNFVLSPNIYDTEISGSIIDISVGSPPTVTTASDHGLKTGDMVIISGTNSVPAIDTIYRKITVTGPTTFTLENFNVTEAGTAGTFRTDPMPSAIVSGLFNADGFMDLAVANYGSNDISIFLGNGDGTFSAPVHYPCHNAPTDIIVAKINSDAFWDLAVVNNERDEPGFTVLLGVGDGTFNPALAEVWFGFSVNVSSIASGNFNADGNLDFAALEYSIDPSISSNVRIYKGNGDGTFTLDSTLYSVGKWATSIVATKFDSDANLDLGVANFIDNNVSVLTGNGNATFNTVANYPVGNGPVFLLSADFDNDSKNDLISINKGENNRDMVSFHDLSGNQISFLRNDGVIIAESDNITSVNETGPTTDTYTIKLASSPSVNVDIYFTYTDTQISLTDSADNPIASVIGFITFTPGNYGDEQTIKVTAVDDGTPEGSHLDSIIHTVVSGDGYFSGLAAKVVSANIIDNDQPGVSLYESGGRTEVVENGTTDTYTVVLDTNPGVGKDVTIDIDAGNQMIALPTSLLFTSADWNTPQTVTLTAKNDAIIEGSQQRPVSHSATSLDILSPYHGIGISDINVNIIDDNIYYAGFLCPGILGDVNHDFRINKIDVHLVQYIYTVTNEYNYCAKNVLNLAAIGPQDITRLQNAIIHMGNYTNEVVVYAMPIGSSTEVSEAGETDTYQVFLHQAPLPGTQVVVDITISDGQTITDVSRLTFKSTTDSYAYWNGATHEVTVSAIDDHDIEGPHTGIITQAINVGLTTDTNYLDANGDGNPIDPVSVSSVLVNIIDDDAAGFTVSIPKNLTSEDLDTGSFFILLTSQPTDNVTISLSSDTPAEGTLSGVTELVIAPLNWDNESANTIIVTGVDDAVLDGPIDYNIITGAAVSPGDSNYDGLAVDDIPMTNQDNEAPGFIIQIKDSAPQTTTESGGTLTVQFSLLSAPPIGDDITIPLEIQIAGLPDESEGTLSGVSQIVIARDDWNQPAHNEVTITGVDDFVIDGPVQYYLVTGDPVSTLGPGDPYNDLDASFIADLLITNLDNDIAGISVSTISGNTTESGGTATFTVVLDSEPIDDVTIGFSSSDTTEGTVLPIFLTFTNANWDSSQLVTVTGVDDSEIDGDISYTIITASAVSFDIDYSGQNPADVAVINLDNDDSPGPGSVDLYTPAGLTCVADDLTVNDTLIKTINWNFTDNNDTVLGFRLYGTTLIRQVADPNATQIQEPDVTGTSITGLLGVNQSYTRTVRAYNSSAESGDSNPATCYTLANQPNPVSISESADSLTVTLDPEDGNPSATLYAISVVSGSVTKYVDPTVAGNLSDTETWHTYADFLGAGNIVVTGAATVTGASVQMALDMEQDYCVSAQAKNGDGFKTDPSVSTCTSPLTGIEPNITATKGVAINLAWSNTWGLFSTAWAGSNLLIDTGGPLSRTLSALSWLLNIALIILLIIFGLSLQQTFKHLKHDLHISDTPKLLWSIVTGEAHDSYKNHASQSEEGVYNKSSYTWHKNLHNISQGTFLSAIAVAGLKLLIIGALVTGLVNLNHSGLAQSAPYNQSGTPVQVGDTLSYIIEVTNNITATNSDAPVVDATVTDNLDSNLDNFTIPSLSNCGDYTDNSTLTALNITGVDVAVGTTCIIRFTAKVKVGTEGTTITNQAQVIYNSTTINTNTTSNQVQASVPTNGNQNINQPPTNGNQNINQPPTNGNQNTNINQPPTNGNQNINLPPTNGNQNINQPPQPPTNGNINQPPIVPPGTVQPPEIPIIGTIIDIFDNPQVEQVSQNIVTPILITIAALNTIPAVIILSLYLLPWLHLLFIEPFLILFGRKRKKWGIVYNSLTKLPVDLALVRLYNRETNRLIQTRVTDKEGRYIMIAKEPGKYYLSVTKPGFNSPSRYLQNEQQDTKYMDLYHGEVIEVTEKDAVLTANIPVDPAEKTVMPIADVIRSYAIKNLRLIISYLGMILALIIVLIIPTIWTIGALIIHILLFLVFRRFINPPKPKSWGIVYDSQNKEPLKNSVVRIFDTKFNKLLETQVTDTKGRYSFLVGQNEYQLLTEKSGYQNREIKPVDLVNNEEIVNQDIGLDKS